MKTFNDLEFKEHIIGDGEQAVLNFNNGYGVSVVFGDIFHSDGLTTYEVALLIVGNYNGDEPLGYLTIDELNSYMVKVQSYEQI